MSRPIPQKRILPSKEASLFKDLLTLYESRQLKKGLKAADQILKKFPEHGETLCMKGLVLTHMGRRDEGIDLVKQGMRLDLTSHICWHVFGLIQKGEKNYDEALKSYTQALKFDRDNLNILRDAAHLQTQLRFFDALVETRFTILRLRPNFRQHWIALAVAYHLNGNLAETKKVLEQYERTLKNIPDYDVEQSETLLYHVRVLEDLCQYREALDLLELSAKDRTILDRTAIMEYRARLLTALSSSDAQLAWRALIDLNPDCYAYYAGYLSQEGLSLSPGSKTTPQSLKTLLSLSSQIPRASAPKRLALTLATGSQFAELIKPYILSGLQKGIPSLFSDLKALYSRTNPEKQIIIQEYLESLFATSSNPLFDGNSNGNEEDQITDPSTHIWLLYYLAQHYSHLSAHSTSLSYLALAISHTPTLPDLFTLKARVLKRCGDYIGAAMCTNEARLLDGQDRFLNTKTGKYLLRAGMINEAVGILGLFTKKDAPSPSHDLEEMQSFLYLLEEASAYRRLNKLNLALKRYMAVIKVIENFEDDQFDFHGYNLRKFTVNAYLNMVSWEDHVRAHPNYVTAALSAAQIFIQVHDDPSIATAVTAVPQMTDEAKKAKKKAKKAAVKAETDKKGQTTSQQSANEDKGLEPPTKDDDPEGIKLLSSPEGLENAAKLLRPLTNMLSSPNAQVRARVEGMIKEKERMEVWLVSYDVAIRRRKLLQALTSLTHAQTLNGSSPGLHLRLVHLHHFIKTNLKSQIPPAPIGPAFIEGVKQLGVPDENQVSLETYNLQYLQKHTSHNEIVNGDEEEEPVNPAEATLACARAMLILGTPLSEVEDLLLGLVSATPKLQSHRHSQQVNPNQKLAVKLALEVERLLEYLKSERVKEFRGGAKSMFPLSTVFLEKDEVDKLKEGVLLDPLLQAKEEVDA